MPIILRVETDSGGELNSVPFVWTSGPRLGPGRTIDSLAKVAPSYLALIQGSRRSAPLDNNRVQETFTVLAKQGNLNTQAESERLAQMFRLAIDLQQRNSQEDTVWFVDQVHDEENARRSVIYSGVIVPIDDGVVTQDQSTDHALFAVTVERDAEWEYGKPVVSQNIGWPVNVLGGHKILPSEFSSNGTVSRIPTIVVRSAKAGYLQKIWMGIKPNRTGIQSDFDLEVRIGESQRQIFLSSDAYRVDDFTDSSAAPIYDGKVVIDFSKETDWTTRFRCPINKWNPTTAGTEANRIHYIGDYHFVCRYRVLGEGSLVGVRVGAGWEWGSSVNWNQSLFLSPKQNSDGFSQWHFADFGTISIASSTWGADVRERLILSGFNIFFSAQKARGDNAKIEFDNGFLIPSNHFLYLDTEQEFGNDKRVEVYTSPKGAVNAFLVESEGRDQIGKPLSSQRQIYSTITELTYENWGVPWEAGSVMVMVGDRQDASTKAIGSQFRVDFSARKRVQMYSPRNVET